MLLAALPAAPAHGATSEEVLALDAPGGAPLRLVLVRPENPPLGAVLLIPGGEGYARLTAEGRIAPSNDFVVRARRLFARDDFAAALVALPENDGRRLFDRRVDRPDRLAAVVAALAQLRTMVTGPVWAVGAGEGAASAVAAAALARGGPDGAVLTAAVTGSAGLGQPSLDRVRLQDIRVPLLFVHHAADGCVPHRDVAALVARLRAPAETALLTFSGGAAPTGAAPAGTACGPLSPHGFYGLEREVVTAIARWIRTVSGIP